MLGVQGQLLANSGDGGAAQSGGGGGGEVGGGAGPSSSSGTIGLLGGISEEDKLLRGHEEGDRSSLGGNRWPRQETLALLKIRSDMDAAFRDSSLKGPLWEDVARKLGELGYNRSAKKCKEKFENVYKYHKRTKEGRASKSDSGGGKTYRFFDQLQALDTSHHSIPPPKPQPQSQSQPQLPVVEATPVAMAMPSINNFPIMPHVTFSTSNPINISYITTTSSANPTIPPPQPPSQPIQNAAIPSNQNVPMLNSPSSSSSTSSDEEPERRGKRKRKWEYFFERLMKSVIGKQEEMQRKFLETLEKRERDRVAREEAWKMQEMARLNREHELLVQERSIVAAKDAAVIGYLQKISEQHNPNAPEMQVQVQLQEIQPPPPLSLPLPPVPVPVPTPSPQPALQRQQQQQPPPPPKNQDNGGENFSIASPSRWPKAEVEALIKLRTNLDLKYHDSSPKGPLWEEISAAMRKLGYNRNSKRCKEKWENINKYYKKVKDSNKKRPEDSKTCPYFDQLDALYRQKNNRPELAASSSFKSENNPMVPMMVQPEQQWPVQQEQHRPVAAATMEGKGGENMDPNNDDNEDDYDDDEEEEDEGGGYEVVANKPSSMASGE